MDYGYCVQIDTDTQNFAKINERRSKSGGLYDCYLGFITGGSIGMDGDGWVVNMPCYGKCRSDDTIHMCVDITHTLRHTLLRLYGTASVNVTTSYT